MSEHTVADEEEARDENREKAEEESPREDADAAEESPPPAAKKPAKKAAAAKKEAGSRGDRGAQAAPARKRPGVKKSVEASEAAEEVVAAKVAFAGVTIAEERAARRALAAGVSLAVLGLALVGTGPSEAGMAITIAGLIALIYGIHTFGRLGPEPAK